MDKRYQVFISSTYADLKEERSRVIQTVMEMDCIPAGMEIFPAIDEEQFNFIKRVIDDCDYYIVIIGGKYGSLSDDGISFTEKEFDYAISKGIKVIALLHKSPEKISVEKSEIQPVLRQKLEDFREKVSSQRLVKYWEKTEDLPGLVSLSLSKTIKTYPAIGWVRANAVGNSELLLELNELRKKNEILNEKISNSESSQISDSGINSDELASLEDSFTINGTCLPQIGGPEGGNWEVKTTWGDIFYFISPYLLEHPSNDTVKKLFSQKYFKKSNFKGKFASIDDSTFQTLKVHLISLGLIKLNYDKTSQGSMALFWTLTDTGQSTMKNLRSVKKK